MNKIILILLTIWLLSGCNLFDNSDLTTLISDSGGSITLSGGGLSPDSIYYKSYTNVSFYISIGDSTGEISSVEADLSELGLGVLSLNKYDDVWSNQLILKVTNVGTFPIIFAAVNQYGKIKNATNYITVSQLEAIYVSESGDDKYYGVDAANPIRSINHAIEVAYSLGAKEVRISEGTYGASHYSGNALRSGVTLIGGYNNTFTQHDPVLYPTILDGFHTSYHLFNLSGVNNCTLKDLVIQNGSATHDFSTDRQGGAILVLNSELDIINCIFSNHQSLGNGGVVYNYNSSINISNCNFINNQSGGNGGALYSYQSSLFKVQDCVFSNNTSVNGGGIYSESSFMYIEDSILVNNSVSVEGGGLYFTDGYLSMSESVISHCSAVSAGDSSGGGAYLKQSSIDFRNNQFNYNLSDSNWSGGGGIFTIYLSNSSFSGNMVSFNSNLPGAGSYADGGGMYISDSDFDTFIGNNFNNNFCQRDGAGLYISSIPQSLSLVSNIFISNIVNIGNGSALFSFVSDNDTFDLLYNRIEANTNITGSGYNYGAIVISGTYGDTTCRVENNLFIANDTVALYIASMYIDKCLNNMFSDTYWYYVDSIGAGIARTNVNDLNNWDQDNPSYFDQNSFDANTDI